jgi:hypothetical protein
MGGAPSEAGTRTAILIDSIAARQKSDIVANDADRSAVVARHFHGEDRAMPPSEQPTKPPIELPLPGESALPAELRGPTPRAVPESVHQSRLAMKRRNISVGCIAAGIFCLAFGFAPFIKTLAIYVLPLGYLVWIGREPWRSVCSRLSFRKN